MVIAIILMGILITFVVSLVINTIKEKRYQDNIKKQMLRGGRDYYDGMP